MYLTKEQKETIELEYSREHEFEGYTKVEIFRLGMKEVLDILNINELDK